MKYSDLLKTLWVVFAFAAYPIYLKAETSNDTRNKTNIILFIGDGMSIAQWQTGMIMSDTPLNIERMHSVGIMTKIHRQISMVTVHLTGQL